jgi:hypothetical protein
MHNEGLNMTKKMKIMMLAAKDVQIRGIHGI